MTSFIKKLIFLAPLHNHFYILPVKKCAKESDVCVGLYKVPYMSSKKRAFWGGMFAIISSAWLAY